MKNVQVYVDNNTYYSIGRKGKKTFESIEIESNKLMKRLLGINTFSTNAPLMDKPGSGFLLAKCLKNACGRVTF